MTFKRPVVYQERNGERELVDASFVVGLNGTSVSVARFDRSADLVIDPTLVYSKEFGGGGGGDSVRGIAVDAFGSAYVAGDTFSNDFPTLNPVQATRHGQYDAFATKLNPAGDALVYSTYFGGAFFDFTGGIAVNGSGSAFVVGTTLSTDFPTSATAFQKALKGNQDAFVFRLGTTGNLIYSTGRVCSTRS